MEAVTYIDPNRDFKTFRFNLLKTNGISRDLMSRLKYAYEMLESRLVRASQRTRSTNAVSQKATTTTTTATTPSAAAGDGPGVALTAEHEDVVAAAVATGRQAAANALATIDAMKKK